MQSKIARGGAFQRWCAAYIHNHYPGSVCHNEVASSKAYFDKKTREVKYFSHRNDILACADLVCIIPGCKVVFIQATLHSAVHKRLLDIVAIPWNLEHTIVQLWQDKGKGRKVIKQFTQKDGVSSLYNKCEILRGKLIGIDEGELFK